MTKISVDFKKIFPHATAIFTFLIISAIYFSPQLKGYQLNQSDISHYLGMSKEIIDHREKFDEEPLWTNSMFGGMPAYQISVKNPNWVNSLKNQLLKLIPRPIGYMFFLMIGFYILMLCFGVNFWLAIIASIAFGLSSFNILYLATGHVTKVHALSFLPPIIGSIFYAYRKNLFVGGVLLSVFLCLHISANHLQMTYNVLYLILFLVVVEFYLFWKNQLVVKFLKISTVLLISGIIGTLPTITNLISTYEYGKYSIRGNSELTISPDNNINENVKKQGLDKEYIKQYSLGFGEVWSIVIPNVKGGRMGYLGQHENAIKLVDPTMKETISQQPSYWGEQLSTGGAFYYGAVIFMLFVLGMFFIKDKVKWALFSASVLAIILSWKYGIVTDFFIDYVPLFNKFRDTKMMLILLQISFPLLGLLFVHNLDSVKINKKKYLKVSVGTIGLIFLFYLLPNVWFDFMSRAEIVQFNRLLDQYKGNPNALSQIELLKSEITNARIEIFKLDCMRSLIFMFIAASFVYLYIIKKLRKNYFYILLGIIVLVDLWGVDKRYLNNEKERREYISWINPYEHNNPYQATIADNYILQNELDSNPEIKEEINKAFSELQLEHNLNEEELRVEKEKIEFRELNFATNYRVLSLLNPFNNSRTSYYHKSLGGYHGAKLKIYQEMLDFYIVNELMRMINTLNSNPTQDKIHTTLSNDMPVINMLNTKYVIYNTEAPAIINPYRYGNAWFINKIEFVENADNEILKINDIDKSTAIIQNNYTDFVPANIEIDSTAEIKLVSYKPNHLVYESSTQKEQFAVFSEIYYPAGWNAYIDNNPVAHCKANYFLRGLTISEGKHKIEFKFEPRSYMMGKRISLAGSVFMLLFVISVVFLEIKRLQK